MSKAKVTELYAMKGFPMFRPVGCCLIAFLLISFHNSAQPALKESFRKLSCPEKRWVIFHPFIARKSYRLTQAARAAAKEMLADSLLDKDENGGQIDAFRHAYWMALLSQNICWRKARRLGIAHEKGNYRQFKKGVTEEGMLPDSVAGVMDLYNNQRGIEIGKNKIKVTVEELRTQVRDSILAGKMLVIKKNGTGDPLNCNGDKIDLQQYRQVWGIPKCLVPSSTK